MSRIFAAGVATPANWFSPVFPCLRNNRIAATMIPFPRTGPQVVPGHVLAPQDVIYLPYPQAAPIEVVKFEPTHFGLTENEISGPLSSLQILQELKHGEFSDVTMQLNEILSCGLEQGYFEGHSCSTTKERTEGKLAAELIERITPERLHKIYRIAGRLFFDWIDRCAAEP
jgi:hypothetical protein